MLVLSLFPGIGLLDRAFEAEGFCVVRGPDVLWGGDVRRFHPPPGVFDGVIGGPPCQCFSSLARLVRATGRRPKFGNLIPEFSRCVVEAQPQWFVMENVPQAPGPVVPGYGVKPFLLNNAWLPGDDHMGQEQSRLRRFNFGVRGVAEPPSLLRWIDLAVFQLPEASGAVTQWTPDNSAQAKTRKRTVTALGPDHLTGLRKSTNEARRTRHETITGGGDRPPGVRTRRQALLSRPDAVPVKIGGSGKVKSTVVVGGDGGPSERMRRYRLPDACRLQGLPEGFLTDAPFTAEGKLKAVANGVPLPMGRAIARAVREALAGGVGRMPELEGRADHEGGR